MKTLLTLLVVAISIQCAVSLERSPSSTSSLESRKAKLQNIIAVIKKAKDTEAKASDQLCETITNIGSLNITEYINATIALTNLTFYLDDVEIFMNKLQTCFTFDNINGPGVIRNFEYLLYQMSTYLLNGFTMINQTGPAIAGAFGQEHAVVIGRIILSCTESYNKTFESFTSMKARFEAAVKKGVIINSANYINYLSLEIIEKISAELINIEKQLRYLHNIIRGFTETSKIVDSIVDEIQNSFDEVSSSSRKALRDFDLAVSSSADVHIRINDEIVASMLEKVIQFNSLIGEKYFDNINATVVKQHMNLLISGLSYWFFINAESFRYSMNEYELTIKQNFTEASIASSMRMENVTSFIAVEAGLKGSTAAKCLSHGKKGEKTVKKFVSDNCGVPKKCMKKQTELAVKAESRLIFRQQNLQLQMIGGIEQLCGCVQDDEDATIECLESTIMEIETSFNDIFFYMVETTNEIQMKLEEGTEDYFECVMKADDDYDKVFKHFRTEILACMAN